MHDRAAGVCLSLTFFGALAPDAQGSLDGARDVDNLPLAAEPKNVRDDLAAITH